MPSSSLAEVEVGVEVEVGGWLGWGGVVGEVRDKANLNSSCSCSLSWSWQLLVLWDKE